MKPNPITWASVRVKLGALVPWSENPRLSTKKQAERIINSFKEFGQVQAVAIGPNNEVYDGHSRLSALLTLHGPDFEIDARQASRELSLEEIKNAGRHLGRKCIVFCANCDKAIVRNPTHFTGKTICCSPECRVKLRKSTGYNDHRKNRVALKCKKCGKSFELKRSAAVRGKGKFCSKECYISKVRKRCEVCDKEILIKQSHAVLGYGKYCSVSCRGVGYKRRGVFAGANHWNYKDGNCNSKENQCRRAHLKRASKRNNGGSYTEKEWVELCATFGNKCLCCGKTGVKLTVDHVIPLSNGGRNDIGNIQPLCKSCNCKKWRRQTDFRINAKTEQ